MIIKNIFIYLSLGHISNNVRRRKVGSYQFSTKQHRDTYDIILSTSTRNLKIIRLFLIKIFLAR
jgi:hypothetical protein